MPPQISDNEERSSDDEASVVSEEAVPIKQEKSTVVQKKEKPKVVAKEEKESLRVESDKDEKDEDDEDEAGEDEYVVEAIMSHLVDEETSDILYEVKWEGFEKKSDRTWEPEANLETAPEILAEYLAKVGGKDLILSQFEEKKAGGGKGKKRGRARTTSAANGTPAKKGRKNGTHPGSSTPPAGAKEAEFKPPTGSWEEEVVGIDACEGNAGAIVVYLTWRGGQKTQHPLPQVYKRCPQRMLQFYESHLVFKKNEGTE